MGTIAVATGRLIGCLLVAVALVSCSGPQMSYVKTGDVGESRAAAFFRLPADWATFDGDEIFESLAGAGGESSATQEQLAATQWVLAFDADPAPSIDHLGQTGKHPVGFARVRTISPMESNFTEDDLRNEVFRIDQLQSSEGFELLASEDLKFHEGIVGSRLTYSLETGTGKATVGQVGAYDSEARVAYMLVVLCESVCYDDNEEELNRLMDSWTMEVGTGGG